MTDASKTLSIGRELVRVRDVIGVLEGRRKVVLDPDADYRARIRAGAGVVQERVASGEPLYGVTTGFGDSCETSVPLEQVLDLQKNLLRYHGCGTGPVLDDRPALAVLVVRMASLSRGFSGVREDLLEGLAGLIEHRILPQIPTQGSVGASGDLTPLSYVAAALIGEREVSHRGEVVPTAQALEAAGLEPLVLQPKEGLAIMNGTSVMTALGCVCWDRGWKLARWATAITSMLVDVLGSNRHHFDPRIDGLKPHPGQRKCADWLRADIEWAADRADPGNRLQDRYSVRCAPHVIGVLIDALNLTEQVLDVEINSVNDNPLVDPEQGDFVNGGNFYGGHVAFALDALKTAIANVAGLLDRQIALLCGEHTNNGLPANLVLPGPDAASRHGFKAMQISASAVAAEALKLTMPASVFSRSTECHNQDVVSMGSHSAQDCLQILDRSETVAAICTLAVAQGVDLRAGEGCHRRSRAMHQAIRAVVPKVEADRRQDVDVAAVLRMYRAGDLPVGGIE